METDSKPWQCEFCTYMNEPTWLVCGMCFKELENANSYQLDFPNINTDDLIGLDTAPNYPVQPAVPTVSAAAAVTTNASKVFIQPIPAATAASTSAHSYTAVPVPTATAHGYISAEEAAQRVPGAIATGYVPSTGAYSVNATRSAPFSIGSTQNITPTIPNNFTAVKYTPYSVAPVATTAAVLVNGSARITTTRRLVRVTAPTTVSSSNAAVTSAYSDAPRVRVINPQSNPSYFISNGANKVTSTTTSVPTTNPFGFTSFTGKTRIPLLSNRTETPFTFPTQNNHSVTAVTPSALFSTPVQNSSSYSGTSSVTPAAPFTGYNAIAQPDSTNPFNFVAPPVVTPFSNVVHGNSVAQLPPTGRTETPLTFPTVDNNAATVTANTSSVPKAPLVTGAVTLNGARVTTAAFADALATDSTPGWMCSYCTFINDNLLLRCAVCDTKKPENKPDVQPVPVLPPAVDYNPNVVNDGHFECPQCYLLYAQNEGMLLENCGHRFCKNCLRDVINYSAEFQLKCPYKIRGVLCNSLLTDEEIASVLNSEYVAINESNIITTRPAEQNSLPGPSQQNIVPGPSQQNIAVIENVIDLCSDNEDEVKSNGGNLPNAAGRNPPRVIGNELTYQELLELEKEVIIPNRENFECTICMTEQGPGEGVVMRDCLHMFCRECLKQAIKCSTDAEMKCPFGDGKTRCESTLQDREIKALVDAADFEKHLSRSIKEAENKIQNTFHCKTADCVGWCEYEEEVTEFACPVCCKTNCINCKAIHTGLDCKQYQINVQLNSANNPEDAKTSKMLQAMLKKGTAMHCPKCAIILSKVTGCDWLLCSMCKTEICWVTRGPRWGSKGRGDTSGGCRCRFNGKRCHPKCGNCH